MTPIETTLYQQAIQEVQNDNQWSIDRLAAELRSDCVTVKRFLHGSAPENDNQQRHLTKLLTNIEVYLESYVKPRPRKIRPYPYADDRTTREGREIITDLLDRDLVGQHIANLVGTTTGIVTKWRTGSMAVSRERLGDLKRVQEACRHFPDLYGAELARAATRVLNEQEAA